MKFVTGVLLKSDPALRTFLLRLKRSNPELFGGRDVAEIELGQDYLFISHAHADIALKLQPYIDDWLQRTTYGDGTSAANRMDDDFADSDVDG